MEEEQDRDSEETMATLEKMCERKTFVFRFIKETTETDTFTQAVNALSQNLVREPEVFSVLLDVETKLRTMYSAYLCRIPERVQVRMYELARIVSVSYADFVSFVSTGKLESHWNDVNPGVLLRARDSAKVTLFLNDKEIEARWSQYMKAIDDANDTLTTFYTLLKESFQIEHMLLPPLCSILIKSK